MRDAEERFEEIAAGHPATNGHEPAAEVAGADPSNPADPRLRAVTPLLEGLSGVDLAPEDDPAKFQAAARKAGQRLADLEAAVDDLRQQARSVEDAETPLDRYAAIPFEERAELLDTRDHIAATIHANWATIHWTLGVEDTRYGVNTTTTASKKYDPAKIRVELERQLGWEPAWTQIHRGLKAVAELSGGEETVDEHGRVHVHGGDYEYHEVPAPDGSQVKKVLYEAQA